MLKSIQHLKYLGYDDKTKLYSSLYKITDDDFEEEVVSALDNGPMPNAAIGADAVILCYENKSLPVAKNLIKMFQQYEKQYIAGHYSIQKQIYYCEKHQPLFLKYKEEVEKYLLLL